MNIAENLEYTLVNIYIEPYCYNVNTKKSWLNNENSILSNVGNLR